MRKSQIFPQFRITESETLMQYILLYVTEPVFEASYHNLYVKI